MNIFKKSKSPSELVKLTKEAITSLPDAKNKKKAVEDISKYLNGMKGVLYGSEGEEPNVEASTQLANEIYNHDLLPLLITNMRHLEFEARKDFTQVFNNLLRRQIGNRFPTVEYALRNNKMLESLVKGYEIPEVALCSGSMLRECIKHEILAEHLLTSESCFNSFFEYVELSTFDIASDAFATFKELLTKHKKLVADYLEANYNSFIEKYTNLLNSTNYVTRRQSLKLLGDLLLERSNFAVMTKYIGNPENLKLMMNFLRDKSKNIQYEAFHVFKVFVANPNKPKAILDILLNNQEKLVAFLEHFQNEKDDEQFADEKSFLIKEIKELKPAAA